jgi:hypothetical protein
MDRLIIFKKTQIYATHGNGLNLLGSGQGYAEPYLISEAIGCTNQNSIVNTPPGLMFAGNDGIYVLDKTLKVNPIGDPVRYYFNDYEIKTAVLIPNRNRVVFLTDDNAIVYDYLHDLWATFTNHTSHDGVEANDVLYLRDNSTNVKVEDLTTWKDGTTVIQMKIRTGWFSFAQIGGVQFVRSILLAGQNIEAHRLRLKTFIDEPVIVDDQIFFSPDLGGYMSIDDHYGAGLAAAYEDKSYMLEAGLSRIEMSKLMLEITDGPAYDYDDTNILQPADIGANDSFGYRVGRDGDWILGGAPWQDTALGTNAGAAYFYRRDPDTGVYSEWQKVESPDGAANDAFGQAVCVWDKWAFIGAPSNLTNTGAVYVYKRTGQTWTYQYKLTASDAATAAYFGRTIVCDGDHLVIGSPYRGFDEGGVYFFELVGQTWTEQQVLGASGHPNNGDLLGSSIAIDGDRVVAGAPDGNSYEAAYVYLKTGATWAEEDEIQSPLGVGEKFGFAVGIYGDRCSVGAYQDFAGPADGSVFVFSRSGSTWSQDQKLIASDAGSNDWFGYSIWQEDNFMFIGAPQHEWTGPGGANYGAIYVFTRSGSVWTEFRIIECQDLDSYFGYSMHFDISDWILITGAVDYERPAGSDAGAIYVLFNPSAADPDKSFTLTDISFLVAIEEGFKRLDDGRRF